MKTVQTKEGHVVLLLMCLHQRAALSALLAKKKLFFGVYDRDKVDITCLGTLFLFLRKISKINK